MPSSEEIVPIVDIQDTIIDYKPRSSLSCHDIYRVASLAIVNPGGDKFLLAQRASWKSSPYKWAFSVDGTVEKGETYKDNIIKEAYEEIWLHITDNNLQEVWHCYVDRLWEKNNFRHTLFLLTSEENIIDSLVLEDAVEAIRWWTIEELIHTVDDSPNTFTSWFTILFPQLVAYMSSKKNVL